MKIDLSLIPEYQEWVATNSDLDFMLTYNARFTGFAAIINIIDPPIRQIDGMYILTSGILKPDNYLALKDYDLLPQQIEYRVNRLRMVGLFQHDPDVDTADTRYLTWLAEQIAKYWAINLKIQFPELDFAVEIIEKDIDPEVTFYLKRE